MRWLLSALTIFALSRGYGDCCHGDVPYHFVVEGDWIYYNFVDGSGDHCLCQVGPFSPHYSNAPSCSNNTGACLISVNDLIDQFQYETGLRLAFKILPDMAQTWEFRFTGLLQWEASQVANCFQTLEFPFNPNHTNDFIYADHANVRYRTHLDTGELNYWRHVTPERVNYFSFSWLAGIRYVEIDEKVRIRYKNSDRKSVYYAKTWNHMPGVQMGFNFSAFPECWFNWGILLKVGLLGNYAKQISKLRDYNNVNTLRDFDHQAFDLGWAIELAPFVYIRPFERFFLRFSWDCFWVAGIAAAPDQLGYGPHSGNVVTFGADYFFRGLSLGVGFEF